MLFLQRTVGNRATRNIVGSSPVTVQRMPSVSDVKKAVGIGKDVKKAVGIGKKEPGAAAKAEQVGAKVKATKIVTDSDLGKQVSTLESATSKLVKAHQPGDTASHMAAFQVQGAAQRILKNLPDQNSKASKVLGGRTYPDQVKRLERVIVETQWILDEVRVENTRRQAQNVYLAAGRTDTRGKQGALTNLTNRSLFDKAPDQPAPNAAVVKFLEENHYGTYEEAFDAVLQRQKENPKGRAEADFKNLQEELYTHTERSRSRAAARTMGLSAAELAAIQTYTNIDFRYINPATADDSAWLAGNHPDLADKPNKSRVDWMTLQDELSAAGQTLDQRMADRRAELTALREEGGLHTGVALQGLLKMPVWMGTAYRGEGLEPERFDPRFVKKGDGFVPRNPTFTWKTITSLTKNSRKSVSYASVGTEYKIYWEFEVINGRDIEGLSTKRTEEEVALLPGAEFAYGPIEVVVPGKSHEGGGYGPWTLRIKAKQIK
jgi:hypothetical protein